MSQVGPRRHKAMKAFTKFVSEVSPLDTFWNADRIKKLRLNRSDEQFVSMIRNEITWAFEMGYLQAMKDNE